MVRTDARPIEPNHGRRDAVGGLGERLQLAASFDDVHHRVCVVGDDQEPDRNR